jgi:hypothetical protein
VAHIIHPRLSKSVEMLKDTFQVQVDHPV